MNQRFLRNIALLLLVWLTCQQVVALALHSVEHSPGGCHEQATSVDCPLNHAAVEHGSHKMLNSSSEEPVCDHCATFCQPAVVTSLPIPPFEDDQLISSAEPVSSVSTPAISTLYRPPISLIA